MCKVPLRSTFTLQLYERDFADVGTAVEKGGGTGGGYEGEVREGEVQGEGEGRTGGIRTVRSHGCP